MGLLVSMFPTGCFRFHQGCRDFEPQKAAPSKIPPLRWNYGKTGPSSSDPSRAQRAPAPHARRGPEAGGAGGGSGRGLPVRRLPEAGGGDAADAGGRGGPGAWVVGGVGWGKVGWGG